MSESEESEVGSSVRAETVNHVLMDTSVEKSIDENSTSEEVGGDVDSDASSEISDIAKLEDFSAESESSAKSSNHPLGLNKLSLFTNFEDYDVITVHGLRDDHKTVWTSQTGKLWVKDDLFNELSIQQLDYFYAIDDRARIFAPDGIKVEARNLLHLYCQHRQTLLDTEVNRPIIWIGHDIGGTIIKQVLMEATQPVILGDYESVAAWESAKEIHYKIAVLSTTIIFLGCPHTSESLEVLQDEVLNLMCIPGPEVVNGRLAKVKNIARQVDEINVTFLGSRLFHRLTCINIIHLVDIPDEGRKEGSNNELIAVTEAASNEEDVGNGIDESQAQPNDQTRVFSALEDSTPALTELPVAPASPFSRYTMTAFSIMETQSRFRLKEIDHPSLVRGDDTSSADDNWVSCLSKCLRENLYPFKIHQSFIRSNMALLTVVPTMRTPSIHMDPEEQTLPLLDWITSQEAYKALNQKTGPQILHVQANRQEPLGGSMLAQYLYVENEYEHAPLWTDVPKGQSFYFEFVKSDHRYNNIRSMLLTFINQAAWHFSLGLSLYHTQKMLAQLENYHSWSLSQLFQAYSTFRSWTDTARLIIFLASFDNCIEDERRWFLSALKQDQARGDIDYCVVITTSGPDEICKGFIDSSAVVALDNCPVPILGYSIDEEGVGSKGLQAALEHTIQRRSVLEELREPISKLLKECQSAPHQGWVILKWLSNFERGAPLEKIAAAVKRLRPVTEGNIVSLFLTLLSQEKRDWALRVYQWVRYAKEPLTVKALGHALALSEDAENVSTALMYCDYEHLTTELEICFSGIIVVDRGEVKFSHDSFNQSIFSNFDHMKVEQPSCVHGLIAKSCLEYIMQDCVQEQYMRLSADNYGGDDFKFPLWISERGLLEYAVQFWVHHYQLAEIHRPLDLALTFFRIKKFRDRWAEAVYMLSNPFTRLQRSYESPLPLMASVGLEDVVSSQIDLDKSSHFFQQDAWLAITEAARNNHKNILINLLALVKGDEASLKDAIPWAAAAQNEDIMTELLDKVGTLESFHWTQSLLSCAAITGCKGLTIAIAKTGFNLNGVDDETGQTALHAAIFWGQRAVVKELLSSEIDHSILDHRDKTPLEIAIEMADPEIVQMLLDKGASVDQRTQGGELIATRAADLGHHMILETLILAGAKLQDDDADTETTETVVRATQNMRKQCFLVLLKHGANVSIQSSDGSLLYQWCTNCDSIEICRALLEREADPNESYSDKEMLLIASLRSDVTGIVNLLIEQGADINSLDPWEDGDCRTPLSFAAAECSHQMIEFLLEKGADINYAPDGACPALFSAALRHFSTERLEFLLKWGAKIDWRRHDGWQALHAVYDIPKSVRVLLKHGADVNAMCDRGSITMMAARWGFKETLEIVVENQEQRPDLDAKFTYDPDHIDYGTTAVRFAAEAGHYNCASFLLESGASVDDEMKDAKFFMSNDGNMSSQQSEALSKLIEQCFERGTKANILDEQQNTVLHHISPFTPVSLVSTLLSMGAPIDNANADGWTPLAVALRERNVPVAKLLLSRGARADVYGPRFGSLLHVVCDWKAYGGIWPMSQNITLLRLLVRHKADPRMPGPEPGSESLLYTTLKRMNFRLACEITSRYLIEEAQADVNFGGPKNQYPLIAATYEVLPGLVQYLIRRGADLEIADDQGLKPSHHASMRLARDRSMLALVTTSRNVLQARDLYGRTPLHFASSGVDWYGTQRLIKTLPQDFDIDIKDSDGWTPLMWACRSGQSNVTIGRLVQDHGADIWALSNDGQWSPLKLANFAGYTRELCTILEPPDDRTERILDDESKQVWDAAFHRTSPGSQHVSECCSSCTLPIIGSLYRCVDCEEIFQLCFKCFPHRSKMHDKNHELKEVHETGKVTEEENEQFSSGDGVGDDDELEEDDDDDDDDDDDEHEEYKEGEDEDDHYV